MDLIQLAKQVIGEREISTIAEKNHIDNDKAQDITTSALQVLLASLAKKATNEESASSLNKALEEDHDGSLLDNISDFLNWQKPDQVSDKTVNGNKILDHILGSQKDNAAKLISEKTGIEKDKINSIIVQLAPVALGILGKAKKEENMDASGLSNLLSQTVKKEQDEDTWGFMGLVGNFLDRDGDGSYMDDLLDMAMKKFAK